MVISLILRNNACDYGGSGGNAPYELKTVSSFPHITYHLLKRGYKEKVIEKIMGGNILRVLKEVQDYSQNKQNSYTF